MAVKTKEMRNKATACQAINFIKLLYGSITTIEKSWAIHFHFNQTILYRLLWFLTNEIALIDTYHLCC